MSHVHYDAYYEIYINTCTIQYHSQKGAKKEEFILLFVDTTAYKNDSMNQLQMPS